MLFSTRTGGLVFQRFVKLIKRFQISAYLLCFSQPVSQHWGTLRRSVGECLNGLKRSKRFIDVAFRQRISIMIAAAPQKKKPLRTINVKIIPVVGRVNNPPLLLAFV